MFRKYRIFRYIQRQKSGKAYVSDLKRRFKITDADLKSWTNLGTNVDSELESYFDEKKMDSELSLTGAGREYIAAIHREIFFLFLTAILAALLGKATDLLAYHLRMP